MLRKGRGTAAAHIALLQSQVDIFNAVQHNSIEYKYANEIFFDRCKSLSRIILRKKK